MLYYKTVEIRIYVSEAGNIPLKNSLKKIIKNKHALISYSNFIEGLKSCSNINELISRYFIKHVEKDLYEAKLKNIRVLHFYINSNEIVLLDVFIKKTKKTPKNIIELNLKRIKDYKERTK